jgi:hypothetical protein
MNEKLFTSTLFSNKKESYEHSVAKIFETDRVKHTELFRNLPPQKKEILTNKKFALDSNEQIKVITKMSFKIYTIL